MQVRRAFLYQEASSFPSVTSTGGQNPPIEQVCGHQGLMINSAGKPGAGKANSTLGTFSSLSVSNSPEPLFSHWKIRTSSFTSKTPSLGAKETIGSKASELEQLREWYVPNWCYLDFEKLAGEYDAIELRNNGVFTDSLPTWDCDCLLVLRAERVREVY